MNAADSHHARALHKLAVEIGEGAIPAFLRARQPSFDDLTGGEILEQMPEALLERLQQLEHHRELAAIGEGACYD